MYTVSLELKRTIEVDVATRQPKYSWIAKVYDDNMTAVRIFFDENPVLLSYVADGFVTLITPWENYLPGIKIVTNSNEFYEVVMQEGMNNPLYELVSYYEGSFNYSNLPLLANPDAYDTVISYDASFSEATKTARIGVVVCVNGEIFSLTEERNCSTIFGAEHVAFDVAVAFATRLLQEIPLGTMLFLGDNQQLISALYAVHSSGNRRIALTKRKLRALDADFSWIPTKENKADGLTRGEES